MSNVNIDKETAISKVAKFLEMNYPCSCGDDPECPGSIYEAETIVEIVMNESTK